MTQCIDFLPSERVRVFISSAQNHENGFAWEDVRRRIKGALSNCVYLNPFIIEDTGSVNPSTQFFQRQVEHSDVVVLLVKSEVRNGTAAEYALASKLKKPLLVYFLDDESPNLDVIKLRKDIQTTDYCTYHRVSSFDNIEAIIRNDLMNDIIRAFQDRYSTFILNDEPVVHTEFNDNSVSISSGIPSKTELAKFISCYDYFYDILNLSLFKKNSDKSEFHELGCSLLSWLVYGKWVCNDEAIIDFITKTAVIFQNSSWLQKRWDAIRYYFAGNLEKALDYEKQALVVVRETNEPDWLMDSILIDCRNIEGEIGNLHHTFIVNSKYQNELNTQKTTVYFPLLDRYLNQIYESIEKDEFKEVTASPYSQSLGSSLSHALSALANYLFIAAIYGSLTHLLISRHVFANVLSRYARIHSEPSFLFSSLRQYVLIGNVKEFKGFLDSTWDRQYSYIVSQADEIWEMTDYVPITYRDAIKLSVFAALGLYFSEDVFQHASGYVFTFSGSVDNNTAESYFEAILANLQRLNQDQILRAIIPILSEKRFQFGNKLSHIILSLDYNQVSEQSLMHLSDLLVDQLPFIIKNGGDPQMIAPLVEKNETLFGKLETLEGNGLSGYQRSIYEINRGTGDWLPVLKNEIASARLQFEKNSKKGVFHGFAHNPYLMISTIIRKEMANDIMDRLLLDEFIPLSIDVLNSEAAVQTKEPCVACLCEVLSSFSKRNIDLPIAIKQALQEVNVDKGSDFFISSTRKALEIRVLMAQVIAGIFDNRSLLRWCVEFETFEIKEKAVIIDCLEKYIYYKKNELNTIDSIVVSIVLQCRAASHRDIRKMAVRCLAYLASSQYCDIATVELNKAAYDSSDSVRTTLLNVCKTGSLPPETADGIISVLCNDAHYCIRRAAKEMMG